jgi:hypothetical protein
MTRQPKAHQTTIRFSRDQWEQLERAASDRDVSVAQYVRDAARERLDRDGRTHHVVEARESMLAQAESGAALWEQGRLTRERARRLRDESRAQRGALADARERIPPRPATVAAWDRGREAGERAQMLRETDAGSSERVS